jgi:demethylmenaquinone methyltransferase/2-methoxy-6-polyprenyl-1,4-benzoquinol methylase
MIKDTVSAERARRFYDRLGARYDWAEFYESQAKRKARQMLSLARGERFLNIGIGTGKEHLGFTHSLGSGGLACGVDLSFVMARLAQRRTKSPVLEADTRFLPFRPRSFDALYAAYVLDLIPAVDIPGVLEQCFHLLVPGGRLLILSLTEGVDFASRSLVAGWKLLFSLAPLACGGCRPLVLSPLVESAGFNIRTCETIVQLGVPSEIILAWRTDGDQNER